MNADISSLLLAVLEEVELLMAAAYASSGEVEDGSPLAQAGLRDGGDIVRDYLDHNEAGVAFEHLLYMIGEPPLQLSPEGQEKIAALEAALGWDREGLG